MKVSPAPGYLLRAARPGVAILAALLFLSACDDGSGDSTPPSVLETVPAEGATWVPQTTTIEVLFDEPVSDVTLNIFPATTLNRIDEEVDPARVVYEVDEAVAPLAGGTTFTVSVEASDRQGNAMPMAVEWQFSTQTVPDSDSCEHANDGECDEPVNCDFGTDATDCVAACEAGVLPHILAAACAYRYPPREPTIDPELGTGGTVHLTGHRDGTILAPSGLNLGSTVHRHYRLYVPATYDPDVPTPLVLYLPGHRVSVHETAQYTQLQRTADMNRFIVVYTEQEWRWAAWRWAWWTDWDWDRRSSDNPDLAFLRSLIEHLGEEYNLDRSRVFLTGHSRGGAMSISAALELSDIIAGALSQSGFTEFRYHHRIEDYRGRHVPLVFVHGARDSDIPILCSPTDACEGGAYRDCDTVAASDCLVEILQERGWTDEELLYYRMDNVGHRWQPQLNQQIYDWLYARPLPDVGEEESP